MNILLWCLTGFLLILSLSQLWEWFLLFWNRPKAPLLRYTLIPLSGSVENMEQLLRYIRLTCAGSQVLLLDRGMDYASRELCRHFCRGEGFLRLLTEEEVKKLLEEMEKELV